MNTSESPTAAPDGLAPGPRYRRVESRIVVFVVVYITTVIVVDVVGVGVFGQSTMRTD